MNVETNGATMEIYNNEEGKRSPPHLSHVIRTCLVSSFAHVCWPKISLSSPFSVICILQYVVFLELSLPLAGSAFLLLNEHNKTLLFKPEN